MTTHARSWPRCRAHAGAAWSVGITGAPGAGKSTLTDRLVAPIRATTATVGVLADRPDAARSAAARSSATGCACRTTRPIPACSSGRWRRAATSAGSRSRRPQAVARARRGRDAVDHRRDRRRRPGRGRDRGHADTTVVVVNPGWGDGVQAAKAGLLEIADVFVVNKADRAGVARDRARPRRDARARGRASVDAAGRRDRRHRRTGASTSCSTRSATTGPLLAGSGELIARRERRIADELRGWSLISRQARR